MGRIRTVKPEWVEDEGLLRAGSDARVLSIALLLLADDYGNGRCIPEVLAAQVFPFDAEPSRVFRESLAKLQEMGFVATYRVREQSYFHVRNWKEHQRVDKPGKPRVPGPDSNGSEWLEGTREAFAKLSREPPETLVPDHDHDHDHERERERARENSREPPSQSAAELLRDDHKRRIVARTGNPPAMGEGYARHLKTAARWCDEKAQLDAVPVRDVVSQLLDGLFGSQNPKVQGDWGMRFLGTDPTEFWAASKPAEVHPSWRKRPKVEHDRTPQPRRRAVRGPA